MQIEKLLEEQRKSLRAIGEGSVRFIATREEIFDWHKQSLKQFIDGLIEWEEDRYVRETRVEDDNFNRAKQDSVSHLKEIRKQLE